MKCCTTKLLKAFFDPVAAFSCNLVNDTLFRTQSPSIWLIHVFRCPPGARLAWTYLSGGSQSKALRANLPGSILWMCPYHFIRLSMIIVDSWGIRDLDIISSFVAFSRYDTRRILRRQPQWKLSSFLSINFERVQVSELYSTADKTSALYKLHLRCTLSCLLVQRFWKLANRCLPSASLQLTSCRSPCLRMTYDPRYLNASMFSNSFPRTSCTLQENTRVATALGLPQYLDWWTFRPLTVLNFLSHLSQVRLASSCSNFDLSTTFFDKPALQLKAEIRLVAPQTRRPVPR